MCLIDGTKFAKLIGKAGGMASEAAMVAFLDWLRNSYDLKHVNFTATGIGFSEVLFTLSTYPQEWIDYFKAAEPLQNDPVLRLARKGQPVDWLTVQPLNDAEAFLLAERRRIIGSKAVSIPVESSDGNTSLMTFVARDDDESWLQNIGKIYAEFRDVGMMLHAVFLENLGLTPPVIELSERHLDCLRMLAAGMNETVIADTLGITEKSVKKYICEAKMRLKAKTKVQAVANALSTGLLSLE